MITSCIIRETPPTGRRLCALLLAEEIDRGRGPPEGRPIGLRRFQDFRVNFYARQAFCAWQAFSMYDRALLTNPLDDFSRSVAAFARLVGRLTRRFVELLAGSVALGADIFAGAGRSDLRIIV